MYHWGLFATLCCIIASRRVLAYGNITFNYPLDAKTNNVTFNYMDTVNISVIPYDGVKDPMIHFACLSNTTRIANGHPRKYPRMTPRWTCRVA